MSWTEKEIERINEMREWINNMKIWQVWKHPKLLKLWSGFHKMELVKLERGGEGDRL